MLEEIRLSGLGVIAEAVLPLPAGLTVLTGETGAGKTMVLTALGLLLGGRGDAALVRPGSDRLAVEGRWQLPDGSAARRRATEAGAEPDDDGSWLVRRTISPDGRSRAQLGGAAVPVGVLGELADELVAVHGQADQRLLVRPGAQREMVDRYAGAPVSSLLVRYQRSYRRRQEAAGHLADLTSRAADREAEAARLRHGLERVAAAGPQLGEDAELAALVQRLGHADALAAAAAGAHRIVSGDPDDQQGAGAQQLAARAARLLHGPGGHDPDLAGLGGRLDEVSALLSELATDLAGYLADLEADPAALAAAQERQAALAELIRVYCPEQPTADGLLAWSQRAAERLAALDGDTDRRQALRGEVAELDAELAQLAGELTRARTEAAGRLAAAAAEELAGLAMPGATLSARVEPAQPGPHGADELALLFTGHPGATPRPLGKSASGGELSRVMLALEVVLAGADPVPTLVFDEVDAGVGGQAAAEVGARLARLARDHQVLVVTHLPQVAAWADTHVRVRKGAAGGVTATDVQVLDHPGRVAELARMLAGVAGSQAAREHAAELLDRAGRRPAAERR